MKILDKIKAGGEELSVNITSMIDVIFMLLIFFMVSTQFKKTSLPLELPETEETVTEEESSATKVLAVSGEGIELDGSPVSIEELEPRLSELYKANPDVAISLECEKSLPFEKVVQVLSKVQNAGISRIGIVHDTSSANDENR